jgi:opacity protein-like surface antigen
MKKTTVSLCILLLASAAFAAAVESNFGDFSGAPLPDEQQKVLGMSPAKAFASGGFKVMGGLAMGNLNISATVPSWAKKTAKMGFMGGVGYESGGQIAYEVDLLYSPGGAVFKPTDTASKMRLEYAATAVTLPIMLKVRFLRGTTPYALAGGEIGYILKEKVIYTSTTGVVDTEDVTDNISRLLYGLVFGGGMELPLGRVNLLLEARYRLGLSNQLKDPPAGHYVKATVLSFTVGARF